MISAVNVPKSAGLAQASSIPLCLSSYMVSPLVPFLLPLVPPYRTESRLEGIVSGEKMPTVTTKSLKGPAYFIVH
jgi:hypothetical protein